MDKDTFYFRHDLNARGDEKIVKLRISSGWEGYGIYWAIIEKMYEEGGPLSADFESLAFDLQAKIETVKKVCECPGLFYQKGGRLGSASVDRRMEHRKEIREARAFAGSKGGKASAFAKQVLSKVPAFAKQVLSKVPAKSSKDRIGEDRIGEEKKTTVPAQAPDVKKETTAHQQLLDWYLPRYHPFDPSGQKSQRFSEFGKSVKKILEACKGDVRLAKDATADIINFYVTDRGWKKEKATLHVVGRDIGAYIKHPQGYRPGYNAENGQESFDFCPTCRQGHDWRAGDPCDPKYVEMWKKKHDNDGAGMERI